MANKTKAELMEEINVKNEELKSLKAEIEKLERYKTYQDGADELAAIRLSYIKAGFSEAEAFEITKMMIQVVAGHTFTNLKRR